MESVQRVSVALSDSITSSSVSEVCTEWLWWTALSVEVYVKSLQTVTVAVVDGIVS